MPGMPQARKWYDVISPRTRLVLVVLVAATPAIIVWAHFDEVSRKQALELERQAVAIQKLADQQAGPFVSEPEAMPAAEEKWQTYSIALDGGRFQIDLPPGTKISGEGSFAYVMADPASESESLPLMAIRIVPDSEGDYDGPGGVTVETGDSRYWLYLWENLEWEPFERAAASFKAL